MESMNADAALDRLEEGNERFRTGQAAGPGVLESQEPKLTEGQWPFAIILACSDSRVAPEILFDTRLGELFIVRVAGNVANQSSIASIEYAVANLGSKLVVVMAHQSCGAVGAAIQGGDAGRNLNHLLGHIQPALDPKQPDPDIIARRNARVSADGLVKDSDIIRTATAEGGVRIVTSYFDFASGMVEFD